MDFIDWIVIILAIIGGIYILISVSFPSKGKHHDQMDPI